MPKVCVPVDAPHQKSVDALEALNPCEGEPWCLDGHPEKAEFDVFASSTST